MTDVLQGDVKVPGLGKAKKLYVYGGLGLAGTYVAWRWYQASRATDDGPVSDYEVAGVGDGVGVVTGGTDGTAGSGNSNVETDGTRTDSIDTNAEWTNKAVEQLANAGYDPATVYAALGEFLARRSLDSSEASIARAALAATGQPPVGGPFSVIESAAPGSTTLRAPSGLKATPTATSATVSWSAVEGASHYMLYRSDLGSAVPQRVSGTSVTIPNLKNATTYRVQVSAVSTLGKESAKSSQVTFATKAVALAKPTGLKASNIGRTSFRVSCSKVAGATYYRWYVNGAPYGASDQPFRDFTSRRANTTYKVTVSADVTNQTPGPQSSALTVKTKK